MPVPRRSYRPWLWAGLVLIVLLALNRMPVGQYLNLGMAPILETLHAPARWWQDISLWFHERSDLQEKYTEVTLRTERQAALVQELNSLREENLQLRNLLGIGRLKGYRWHAAKVHGRSPDKMSQRLLIQVEHAGIDDVIVSNEGLVGLVDEAAAHHAVVRTILDASLAVPVTIKDRPLAALMRGQGDRLEVDFVPLQEAPAIGTVLQTSGAGGVFPPGIPAARITDVKPVPGRIFAQVTAEPVAHWQRDNWLAIASHAGSGKQE